MYDAGSTDSNNVPREGVGIACDWVPRDSIWGETVGHTWGSNEAAYFRTAVHELGHALGLEHNTIDTGYMCTSDVIAEQPGGPFPRQIKWAFAEDDLKRLRHWPDIFVRPGGVPFGGAMRSSLPMTPTDFDLDMKDLELEITPLLAEVPIGAPVRVELKLSNHGESSVRVPASLGLKSPFTSGTVTNALGTPHSFTPLIHCTDSSPTQELKPADSITGSMTLLRGSEGPLFTTTGIHKITVNLVWPVDSYFSYRAAGNCTVFITSTVDDKHAATAHEVLTKADLHVLLMTGGDSPLLEQGKKAMDAALQDPILKKHFALTEARRVATGYRDRKGDSVKAKSVLEGLDAVMSKQERKTVEKLGLM